MKCTAVLFDFDDTLVDSWQTQAVALQRVFDESAIEAPTAEEFFLGLKGGPLGRGLARLEADLGRQLDLFEQYLHNYWLKEPGQLRLYPGVQSLLDRLATAQTKLGIITAKRRSFEVLGRQVGAEHEMLELDILDRFHVVVGFEDVTNPKPHPETIELALSHLGIRRRRRWWSGTAPPTSRRPRQPAAGAVGNLGCSPGSRGSQRQQHPRRGRIGA